MPILRSSENQNAGHSGFDIHWIQISGVDKETAMNNITVIFPCYFVEALTGQHVSSECPSKMTVLLVFIFTL
jgi:hypothetical protein